MKTDIQIFPCLWICGEHYFHSHYDSSEGNPVENDESLHELFKKSFHSWRLLSVQVIRRQMKNTFMLMRLHMIWLP